MDMAASSSEVGMMTRFYYRHLARPTPTTMEGGRRKSCALPPPSSLARSVPALGYAIRGLAGYYSTMTTLEPAKPFSNWSLTPSLSKSPNRTKKSKMSAMPSKSSSHQEIASFAASAHRRFTGAGLCMATSGPAPSTSQTDSTTRTSTTSP